jgi:hypothetical protein
MATTFSDLQFEPHKSGLPGIQARIFFPNGYGASVIRFYGSYGYEAGLYELAVLAGEAGDSEIAYDTDITDDVLGHLSEADVTAALAKIEALPIEPGAKDAARRRREQPPKGLSDFVAKARS